MVHITDTELQTFGYWKGTSKKIDTDGKQWEINPADYNDKVGAINFSLQPMTKINQDYPAVHDLFFCSTEIKTNEDDSSDDGVSDESSDDDGENETGNEYAETGYEKGDGNLENFRNSKFSKIFKFFNNVFHTFSFMAATTSTLRCYSVLNGAIPPQELHGVLQSRSIFQ